MAGGLPPDNGPKRPNWAFHGGPVLLVRARFTGQTRYGVAQVFLKAKTGSHKLPAIVVRKAPPNHGNGFHMESGGTSPLWGPFKTQRGGGGYHRGKRGAKEIHI